MDGKRITHETLRSVSVFFVIYVVLFFAAFLVISFDNFDFMTNFTAVAATINNTGPGFSLVGTTGNYAAFSPLSKYVLSFTMIAGWSFSRFFCSSSLPHGRKTADNIPHTAFYLPLYGDNFFRTTILHSQTPQPP